MVASALAVAGLATTTTVAAASATQTTLSVSKTNVYVGQADVFTVTLKSGTKVLSKPVTVYHYLNGKRYNDITAYTTLTFVQKWTTPGVRAYYASFAGDSAYAASTSSKSTVTVTGTALSTQVTSSGLHIFENGHAPTTMSTTYTFSGGLSAGTKRIPNAAVMLQISSNNKHWSNQAATTTNAAGDYALPLTLNMSYMWTKVVDNVTYAANTPPYTYYFRTWYSGSSQYPPAFSPTVKEPSKKYIGLWWHPMSDFFAGILVNPNSTMNKTEMLKLNETTVNCAVDTIVSGTEATAPNPCIHVAYYLDGKLIPSGTYCPARNDIEGIAYLNVSTLSVGYHTLTAVYAGNSTYYPSYLESAFNVVS